MCEIDFDGEVAEVWNEKEQTARKEYKCCSCGAKIIKGQRYLYHFDVFEKRSCTARMCLDCMADREDFQGEHGVCLHPGNWDEFLSECIYNDDEDGKRWQPMLDRHKARKLAARTTSSAAE